MTDATSKDDAIAVLGAGLTGLTAAHVLGRSGRRADVFEAEPFVGGTARTVEHGGFRFDLGGHRFYTRNEEVLRLVRELVGNDLLEVARRSRIYLGGKLVDYPLSFFNALSALGPIGAAAVAASYGVEQVRWALGRRRDEETFEGWVVRRFGRKLYNIYFKPYSEKVWGVPCSELKADFAAQRIRGLSFREAVRSMVRRNRDVPATLVSRFLYPRLGFGQIPERMAAGLPEGTVRLGAPVVRITHGGGRVQGLTYMVDGRESSCEAGHFISTIPVSRLVQMLEPAAPASVQEAASRLRYRDMVIVFLVLDRKQVTPDHWIYFSSDDVFFGRMHEPKNWSAAMAPAGQTGLVVEIFCFEGEPVWVEAAASLIQRVAQRLSELRLIEPGEVIEGRVIRLPKAYPLYAGDYRRHLKTVLDFVRSFENLQTVGRNGMFRYTSGDYYIEMGMKAAENVLGAEHDLAAVAAGEEYAEA